MKYLYSCKIRNKLANQSAQGRDYIACMVISAKNSRAAVWWGDVLSNCFCSRNPEMEVVDSGASDEFSETPRAAATLNYGEYATDDQIGWHSHTPISN